MNTYLPLLNRLDWIPMLLVLGAGYLILRLLRAL